MSAAEAGRARRGGGRRPARPHPHLRRARPRLRARAGLGRRSAARSRSPREGAVLRALIGRRTALPFAAMARQRTCWSTSSACGARWTSCSATAGRRPAARAAAAAASTPRRRLLLRGPSAAARRSAEGGRQGRSRRRRRRRRQPRGLRPRAGDLRRPGRCARPRAAPTSRSRSRPGTFRRAVELGVDVDRRAGPRRPSRTGCSGSSCRSSCRTPTARRVPIERPSD